MSDFLEFKEKILKDLDSELLAVACFIKDLGPSDTQEKEEELLNSGECINDVEVKSLVREFNGQLLDMISIVKDLASSTEERNKIYRNITAELNSEAETLEKHVTELELKMGIKPEDNKNIEKASASVTVSPPNTDLISSENNKAATDIESELQVPSIEISNSELTVVVNNQESEPIIEGPTKIYKTPVASFQVQRKMNQYNTPESPKTISNSEEAKELLRKCGVAFQENYITPEEPPTTADAIFDGKDYLTPVANRDRNFFFNQKETPPSPEITSNFHFFNLK